MRLEYDALPATREQRDPSSVRQHKLLPLLLPLEEHDEEFPFELLLVRV